MRLFLSRSYLDQPRFGQRYRRDISGAANNGNVGGNAGAQQGSVNVGNGIYNGE